VLAFLLFSAVVQAVPLGEHSHLEDTEMSQLLKESCTQCHSLNRVILQTEKWTMGDWMHAFKEMAKGGPELTAHQKAEIAEYLDAHRSELEVEPSEEPTRPEGTTAETYDALFKNSCFTCHDSKMLNRIPKGLSRQEWEHVAERMAQKAPQLLAGVEKEKIVDYLYKFNATPEMLREKPLEAKRLTDNILYRTSGSVEGIAEYRDNYTFNSSNDSDTGFKRENGFGEVVARFSVDLLHPEAVWSARVSGAVDYLMDRGNSALKDEFDGNSNGTYFDAALEEAWFEAKAFNTPNCLRVGVQEFKSDFLGLIYNDNDLGVRLFGEREKLKWNMAYFYKTKHDEVSEFFDFDDADQDVFIATAQFDVGTVSVIPSFHYNRDRRDDRELDVAYLGAAHYGMVGPFATTAAFYYAFGEDDNAVFNPAESQDISAFHFVADVGYPIGKHTPHVGIFYTSGDDDPNDGDAEGFDSIYDTIGVWGNNGIIIDDRINLGSLTVLRNNSAIPSLRDFYESANFINPGVLAFNLGFVSNWTDKFATDVNLTYFQWNETAVLEAALGTDVGDNVGWETNVSSTYKWNDNLSFTFAGAVLFPDEDMEAIYGDNDNLYNIYASAQYSF